MHNRRTFLEDALSSVAVLANGNQHKVRKLSDIVKANLGRAIFFTGVGKPGFVAMKQAATLQSLNLRSHYLHPMNGNHGDIGMIPAEEPSLLIILSKSGSSSELEVLCDNVKKLRPNCTTCLVSMSYFDNDLDAYRFIDSKSKQFDKVINFNIQSGELDGYGIVPTVSNAIFELALSAAIIDAMSETDNASDKALLSNLLTSHPSGTLHAKVTKLLDIMP